MKKLISMTMLTLGLSSFSHANQNLYALNSAESEAYLVNVQQGRGNQSICTYRSVTRLFGVHQVQASMQNGCLRQVAYMATYDGGDFTCTRNIKSLVCKKDGVSSINGIYT